MSNCKTFNIANGVEGLYIENKRFNTTLVSFNFYLPLCSTSISSNALLTYVLSTSSGEYGSFRQMNLKLNKLYGADVAVSATPVGDSQLLRFVITALNDRFALNGEAIVNEACNYIMSLIFAPRVQNNSFFEEDLLREKRKMLEDIRAELNEKRNYARKRLKEEMFENDPFGMSKYGTYESAQAVTKEELFEALQNMLKSAFVRVQVIGDTLPKGLFEQISQRFSKIKRENIFDIGYILPTPRREQIKRVSEKMDIIQGKLVMGFSSKQFGDDEQTLPLMVAVDIFGGGPYSRLFSVVREKLSLCYYCSASAARVKGFVMVDSGLEAKNAECAEKEILNQLNIVKSGEFGDFEFESSIRSICDSLKSYNDSLVSLDVWYAQKIHNRHIMSPDDVALRIKQITKQQVIEAAKGIDLNTVYLLLPEDK